MCVFMYVSKCVFLWVHVCLCVNVCLYLCVHVCSHACDMCQCHRVFVYVCACVCVNMHACVVMPVCAGVCVCLCVHVCVYVCVSVCAMPVCVCVCVCEHTLGCGSLKPTLSGGHSNSPRSRLLWSLSPLPWIMEGTGTFWPVSLSCTFSLHRRHWVVLTGEGRGRKCKCDRLHLIQHAPGPMPESWQHQSALEGSKQRGSGDGAAQIAQA